ncbi:uncharacterized protein BCR38DRAFT_202057 [Pseudomassariella vexata]|uniref:Uncharacterized protein n=1 Tax=Pseudomassariella vexata TaxID=1141098 RepID=A0A1Y2DX89_9PEZI|nr:uncharacterized protein BCR38DRAFT_202057 [Pseudomassariella vexata]ORY63891.1 hypothetical protein BCR38DRAFT_202057 [Pseudomassariella vexata]
MVALVVILIKIDNTPLQEWSLQIQPNSLIAVLTTVGKAAMMVPAASCLSQLKWRHFQLRPQRLGDLEIFDEASRGPWGSAVLILRLCRKLRSQFLTVYGLAILTILALGFDPSAQQVLEFPLQESKLTNASVQIGRADMYFSKGFLENEIGNYIWVPNTDLLALQSSIANGASGSVFQPFLACPRPASTCTWDTFTTLGVCSELQDVTSIATPNCTQATGGASYVNCTYTWPGMLDRNGSEDPLYDDAAINMKWDPENQIIDRGTMLFRSITRYLSTVDFQFGTFKAVRATTNGIPSQQSGGDLAPPPVAVFSGTFTWCAQTYRNMTASPIGITSFDRIDEPLTMLQTIVDRGDATNNMGPPFHTFVANSTGSTFNISRMGVETLPSYLQTLLTSVVYHDQSRPARIEDETLQMGYALYKTDLFNMTKNVADAISNQIRSNEPVGDNFNATTVSGLAFFQEAYIRVRWPWMIVPLAETAMAAFLLVISMMFTRNQPLLKTSIFAYLFAELEGWKEGDLRVSRPPTQEKLAALAEGMRARWEYEQDGALRLKRDSI